MHADVESESQHRRPAGLRLSAGLAAVVGLASALLAMAAVWFGWVRLMPRVLPGAPAALIDPTLVGFVTIWLAANALVLGGAWLWRRHVALAVGRADPGDAAAPGPLAR